MPPDAALKAALLEFIGAESMTRAQCVKNFPAQRSRKVERTIAKLADSGELLMHYIGHQKFYKASNAVKKEAALPAMHEFKPLCRNPFLAWDLCARDPRDGSQSAVNSYIRG